MALETIENNSVWPSAGARMTASVAMLVAAPGRFSTMTCWPSRSDSHCATRRAPISAGPPAGKPTIKCTGRVG